MFVYVIVNDVNLKIYVGKTINKNLEQYLQQKFSEAKRGISARSNLYAAIRKYGREHFHISSLFEGQTDKEISEHEILLIKALACRNSEVGYNICEGGQGHRSKGQTAWNKGKPASEECRRKLKIARAKRLSSGMRGKRLSEEHRRKLLAAITGRSVSEATRRKLSESNKGQIRSDETRRKLSEYNKIRFTSKEARLKLSEAVKNSPLFEEARLKNSEAHKGRVPWNKGKRASLEARLKMSEAHKRLKPAFQTQS
jgi:group I intron endonuclease